jgi:hypothetical protein
MILLFKERVLKALLVLVILINVFLARDAGAIPSFARATGKSCTSCHTVWPILNEEGRQYKEAGYVSEEEEEVGGIINISDTLTLVKNAFSARVNFRLFDKKKYAQTPDNDKELPRMRSLHEVEIFGAGIAGNNLSCFIELEAEDEAIGNLGGLATDIVAGVLGYHLNEAVNVHFGLAEPIFADPYSAFSDARRVTRGKRKVVSGGFITDASQFVSLSGRISSLPNLFYLVAISGNNKDDYEHTPLGNFTVRAVYDIAPYLSIGGLYQAERAKYGYSKGKYANKANATNIGFDATIQFEDGLDANLCYVQRKDDESSKTDNVIAVEAGYPLTIAGKTIAPYVRVENYTKNGGKDKFTDVHFSLNCLIKSNLRGVLNYEMIDKGPNGNNESRITLVADFGF